MTESKANTYSRYFHQYIDQLDKKAEVTTCKQERRHVIEKNGQRYTDKCVALKFRLIKR